MAKARARYLGWISKSSPRTRRRSCFSDGQETLSRSIYDPIEGHIDSVRRHACIRESAQIGGAEIVRHTRVTDLISRPDGSWDVITTHARTREHVVMAVGCGSAK